MKNKKSFIVGTIVFLCVVIWFIPQLLLTENKVLIFLAQPLTILIPTAVITMLYLRRQKAGIRQFYHLQKLSLKTIGLLTIIALVMPVIVHYVINLFSFIVGEPSMEEFLFTPGAEGGLGYAVLTFVYGTFFFAVFPGVCEEVLF